MNIWIVTNYEPMPFGAPTTRPQRCGMLARALLDRGHDVELWTSTFEHVKHEHLLQQSMRSRVSENMHVQYMYGCGYGSDYSPRRLLHNRQTAREFAAIARARKTPPDVIFAPIPSLELAEAAVQYGRSIRRPVVVDIRDLWPDVYYTMFPRPFRRTATLLLFSEKMRARRTCKGAAALTAVSGSYLNWALGHARRSSNQWDSVFHLGFSHASPGTSEDARREVLELRYGIPRTKTVPIYVGSFSDFYDVQCLLDCAERLKNDERLHFVIVGDGEGSETLFARGRRLPNVTMTGWLSFKDVQALLTVSDMGLVAYSKIATMSLPNKPFEYMAAGLPLISSLKGELEAMITEYGIGRQYQAGDSRSLVTEILWCLDHPEDLNAMRRESLGLFRDSFASQTIYPKLAALLERVADAAMGSANEIANG
jgi:glycosyltransferase involved in cell wall biosynthesis